MIWLAVVWLLGFLVYLHLNGWAAILTRQRHQHTYGLDGKCTRCGWRRQ